MDKILGTFGVTLSDGISTSSIWTLDKQIFEFFNTLFDSNGWGNFIFICLSYLLCIILVGIIGYQREYQGHNAGFRTHLLVAIGSCTVMVISMYSVGYSSSGYETMRLASSIPTGIGFLGAGVIIKNKASIKGLTTASTLWVSMAIGLACGSGNFVIAIIGSLFIYLILFVFYRFEIYAGRRASKLVILLEPDSKVTYKEIVDLIDTFSYNIKDSFLRKDHYEGREVLSLTIEFTNCYYDMLEIMKRDIQLTYNPIKIDIVTYKGQKHKTRSED